jgi:ubiquitin-activating enzyme E1
MRNAGDAQARELLERVVECLVTERCTTIEECITWARARFEDYFANRVKQLTFTFPEDAATSSGLPFWSAPKRFPKPLQFTSSDPSYLSFVASAAILRATTYGISVPAWALDAKKMAEAVDRVKLPEFAPKQGVKIVTDEKATTLNASSTVDDDDSQIEFLIGTLEEGVKQLPASFKMNPVTFEKDDDTNFHMDLIAGLANMRARNYSVPEVDKLKAKFIAGRIIPAIATTTAMATGLVCLELYKAILGHPVERYRNTFANLALPLFSMAEPVPPKSFSHQDLKWSIWDRWIISGDLTLKQLLDWFEARGLTAYSISCGQSLLYNNIFPKHRERMGKKVSDLARDIAKVDVPPNRRHFDIVVACEDEEGEDLDVPLVSIQFR